MRKEPHKARGFRRREQETLDTASRLLLKRGGGSITVEMITDVVGIDKDTIYRHFESKTEIYPRLILNYEHDLAALFHSEDVTRDKEALSRAYLEFRMRDSQCYRLFDRLEEKVVKTSQALEMVRELRKIRTSNFEYLAQLIKERIVNGKLESVPPYSHYRVTWTLTHGAVALHHSPFWREVLEDQEGFFYFLMDIDVHIGNKCKREDDAPSA